MSSGKYLVLGLLQLALFGLAHLFGLDLGYFGVALLISAIAFAIAAAVSYLSQS